MKSTFLFRGIILFCCWGIDGVKGAIDWESIPEGILFGPGVGNVEETDFCGVVRDKSLELNDALRGRNLSVAVQFGPGFDFFQYDPDEELSYSNPGGMVASVLDQLAARAGFSWRNSFVAYTTNTTNVLFGKGIGKWDRMLNWTTSVSFEWHLGVPEKLNRVHVSSFLITSCGQSSVLCILWNRISICLWTNGFSPLLVSRVRLCFCIPGSMQL